MKKSLRWLTALLASVMLLSCAMTSVFATDEPAANALLDEEYIYYMVFNAKQLSDGTWYVPNLPYRLDDETYQAMYQRALYWILNGGVVDPEFSQPSSPLPPFYFPGLDTPPYQTVSLSVPQFGSISLYGTRYTYTSMDSNIARVDSYGRVYGLRPGTTNIICNQNGYAYIVVELTVTETNVDVEDFFMSIRVGETTLEVGESTTVSATLMRKPNYPVYAADVTLSISSGSDVLALNGNTIVALKPGTATICAEYAGDFYITEYLTINVYEDMVIVPGTPSYGYPGYWWSYPNFDYGDYNYWYAYQWYYGYPLFNMQIPVFNDVGIDWASILELDTETYDVDKKFSYINGSWMRTFTLIPKDGAPVSDYDTVVRRVYLNSSIYAVAIKTPTDYVPVPVEPEIDTTLTPEQIEELKKAEEAAKAEAEYNANVAKALEGKMEWYEIYGDLWGDSYYAKAVDHALKNQYVTSEDYDTFGTANLISWGYLEEVLCKYLTMTDAELAETKILTYDDSDAIITREQIALAFQKVAVYLELNNSKRTTLSGFEDYSELDAEYRDAFAWAIANRVLNKGSEKFNPNGEVDKARLCQILYAMDSLKK